MVSITNLIKFLFVFTRKIHLSLTQTTSFSLVLICCQIQLTSGSVNNQDINDMDFDDDLYESLPAGRRLFHENFRRASLRYQPHVLYKKASLRPIIGQNGKLTFVKRDQV